MVVMLSWLVVMVTWYMVATATKYGCHGNMSTEQVLWRGAKQPCVIIMAIWCYEVVLVAWCDSVIVMVARCGSHGNLKPDVVVWLSTWCYEVVLVAWCDCHGIQVWLVW
jgi:hypothetical protein